MDMDLSTTFRFIALYVVCGFSALGSGLGWSINRGRDNVERISVLRRRLIPKIFKLCIRTLASFVRPIQDCLQIDGFSFGFLEKGTFDLPMFGHLDESGKPLSILI